MSTSPDSSESRAGQSFSGKRRLPSLVHKGEALKVVHDFAVGMLEAGTVEELLWDVAAGAIARLGYEDCVIYLVDQERGVLVQRSAYGPKGSPERKVHRQMELKVGEGIVGAVAHSGQGEIVDDVRKDERYVVDDKRRLSEMSVPIVHEGQVLGVMDTESSKLAAYSSEDFDIFSTLASMLAVRLANEQAREATEAALRQASLVAEEAARLKTSFLANISHEIRTPLVAILGVSEILEDLVAGQAPQDVIIDNLKVVSRSGEHLLTLINQLLDIASDDHGRLKIEAETLNVYSVVNEVARLFQNEVSQRGLSYKLELSSDLPKNFRSDGTRLRQILANLIGNAVKFTDQGSICLKAWPLQVDNEEATRKVRVEVHDTGIGIPSDQREYIFESFHQADASSTRRHGGTGLGLAISRRLARRLGGDLHYQPAQGRGSVFVLEIDELPRGDDQSESVHTAKPVPLDRPLRLLLAEDNADTRRLIAFNLNEAGHEVETVADGLAALDAVKTSSIPFDAILLDMQMPNIDGFDVARRLRADGESAPILAITAHAFPGDREECLEAGCSDYLAKPFPWPELLNRLVMATAK